jgi:hypothetical protein
MVPGRVDSFPVAAHPLAGLEHNCPRRGRGLERPIGEDLLHARFRRGGLAFLDADGLPEALVNFIGGGFFACASGYSLAARHTGQTGGFALR